MSLPDDVRGRFHDDPWACPWCGTRDALAPPSKGGRRARISRAILAHEQEWQQGRLRLIRFRCTKCGKQWVGAYALVAMEAVADEVSHPKKKPPEPARA